MGSSLGHALPNAHNISWKSVRYVSSQGDKMNMLQWKLNLLGSELISAAMSWFTTVHKHVWADDVELSLGMQDCVIWLWQLKSAVGQWGFHYLINLPSMIRLVQTCWWHEQKKVQTRILPCTRGQSLFWKVPVWRTQLSHFWRCGVSEAENFIVVLKKVHMWCEILFKPEWAHCRNVIGHLRRLTNI